MLAEWQVTVSETRGATHPSHLVRTNGANRQHKCSLDGAKLWRSSRVEVAADSRGSSSENKQSDAVHICVASRAAGERS